jgi:hypothetical protein
MLPNFARRISRRCLFIFALCAASLFVVHLLRATQIAPLPNFDVQTLDGQTVHTADWPLQGKWLVIYVEPRCPTCVTLLSRLTAPDFPQLPAWTIVVAGGMQPGEVKKLQKRFPDLGNAQWFADPARNLATIFTLQGAPVTFGVQTRVVRWSISGILPDAKQFQSALNTWCTQ